jgi:vacuolar-type H+-ATPase subunit E/Vma4
VALPVLISRLEQEAQLRVDAIRKEAEERVTAIDAATQLAARELTSAYFDAQRDRRQATFAVELAVARRDARARELEATHAQIARILERARQLIDEVCRSSAYIGAVAAHTEESLSFLEGVPVLVRCPASLVTAVTGTVERRAGTRIVVDDSIGPGIVAEAEDGSVVVDNTLRARLSRREADLSCTLAQELGDGRR